MATATIGRPKDSNSLIQESALRSTMKIVEVQATDGTKIPVPAHFIGDLAMIRVDGDGSCTLNQKHNYLVTVINQKKGSASELEKGGMKAAEMIFDDIKSELKLAGLRALNQGKAVQYLIKGLQIMGSLPVTIIDALLFDATDTGAAAEGYIYVMLENRSVAAIRWIG